MINILHNHIALFQAVFIRKGLISIPHYSCLFNSAKAAPKGAFSCPVVSDNGYDLILWNAEFFKLQAFLLTFIGKTEFFKTQWLFICQICRFRFQTADVQCSKSKGTKLFLILLSQFVRRQIKDCFSFRKAYKSVCNSGQIIQTVLGYNYSFSLRFPFLNDFCEY